MPDRNCSKRISICFAYRTYWLGLGDARILIVYILLMNTINTLILILLMYTVDSMHGLHFEYLLKRRLAIFLWASSNFFYGRGASPPALRPWTPHAFGMRILVGTGLRSTAFQQKNLNIFFIDIFFS